MGWIVRREQVEGHAIMKLDRCTLQLNTPQYTSAFSQHNAYAGTECGWIHGACVITAVYISSFHSAGPVDALREHEKQRGQGCTTMLPYTYTQLWQNTYRPEITNMLTELLTMLCACTHCLHADVAKTTAEPINTSDLLVAPSLLKTGYTVKHWRV